MGKERSGWSRRLACTSPSTFCTPQVPRSRSAAEASKMRESYAATVAKGRSRVVGDDVGAAVAAVAVGAGVTGAGVGTDTASTVTVAAGETRPPRAASLTAREKTYCSPPTQPLLPTSSTARFAETPRVGHAPPASAAKAQLHWYDSAATPPPPLVDASGSYEDEPSSFKSARATSPRWRGANGGGRPPRLA